MAISQDSTSNSPNTPVDPALYAGYVSRNPKASIPSGPIQYMQTGADGTNTIKNTNTESINARFDKSKYNIQQTVYPNDLLADNNEYGSNYVCFYIYVNSNSPLSKTTGGGTNILPDSTSRRNANQDGATITPASLTTVAGAAGAISGGVVGAVLGKNIAGPIGAGVGAAIGAGSVQIATQAQFKREMKRIKEAIVMNMPADIVTNYSMHWGEADTQSAATVAAGSVDTVKNIYNAAASKDLEGAMKAASGSGAGYFLSTKALDVLGLGNYIAAKTGTAMNTRKEQLFNGPGFRKFNFQYKLFARDFNEEQNIKAIIKKFKTHMHPEFIDKYQFAYRYPSEFQIVFYSNGAENDNIPKIMSCVLTDFTANYSPNGSFVSRANGAPVEITISMSFTELSLLTRTDIEDGF